MRQFGWLSERGGNIFNLLQKEGVPKNGRVPWEQEGGGMGGGGGRGGGGGGGGGGGVGGFQPWKEL